MKHNTYFDGKVQSLGDDTFTVGVVEPGDYDFGKAERTETILVISGTMTINGSLTEESDAVVVKPGEEIHISVSGKRAAYRCEYS